MAEDTARAGRLSSTIRAPCSIFRRIMPVTRAGLVHVHGPVGHCCSGSRLPPALSGSLSLSPATSPTAPLLSAVPTLPSPPPPEPSTRVIFPIWPSALGKDCDEDSAASWDIAARKMAAILHDVISLNDTPSWNRLYHFATHCLRTPKRGGHRRSQATRLNRTIHDKADPEISAPHSQRKALIRDPLQSLAA